MLCCLDVQAYQYLHVLHEHGYLGHMGTEKNQGPVVQTLILLA